MILISQYVGLAFVQDGLLVHLLVSAVVQGCDTEGARGNVMLFAVVLWSNARFGDSTDTRPSLFWGMFMVRAGAEIYRCNRRNGPDFGRVFLRSKYTDITQNTYIQSSMVTEILAIEF